MTVTAAVAPRLEMRGITKRYPGVVANDAIDLDVRPGEIHALLGENGAGKSTLMNVLYGLATPDAGEIFLDGEPVRIDGPSDAIASRHRDGPPTLPARARPFRRREHPARRGAMANAVFLDREEARRQIKDLGHRFGFEIDPDIRIESLSVGWQQRVEILKALYRKASLLVLDEPTAVLTPQETKEIFAVLDDSGTRAEHHLHQPQAARGPRDRRSDHGHPAGQGGRFASPERDQRGRPGRTDGRAECPARRGSR